MPIKIDPNLTPEKLLPRINRVFECSAAKLASLEKSWKPRDGAPVFTIQGRYASRSWTEWTQGFQFGSSLLQFDATGEKRFLESGRKSTIQLMAGHVSHVGVHDHGFNNISTYGNLLRLIREGAIDDHDVDFYELALKVSGAIQAARWSQTADGLGFIYSFNGPHSLFIDTMRSLRSLAVGHQLGHALLSEHDEKVSLLDRLLQHALSTARYAIYYGEGRDAYDIRGRTAQESIFNTNDGLYRCPSSQQGYSPFTTWTRGLGWALLGYAEQLEFLAAYPPTKEVHRAKAEKSDKTAGWLAAMEKAALATADFCIETSCADGIPMWDTHAPELVRLGDYRNQPADPFNAYEPVDSSAAAILAQGFVRLGNYLSGRKKAREGARYRQAGLTIARTLFDEPYLSIDSKHQGLLLHAVYHRPNRWDYVAPGQKIPNGESCLWGDYHVRELALLLLREAQGKPYLTFFGGLK